MHTIVTATLNAVRIAAVVVWTGIVGVPLLSVIYTSYFYGLIRSKLGKREVLDRILEANAYLAGRVSQLFWARGILALSNIKVRVQELKPINWKAAHVICANHASVFDILALIRIVPPPFRFVAKRELLRWPIIGWALRPAGQIIIDRSDHAQAVGSITREAVRKIRGQVIFFVEGTRSRTGRLQPFKKGAFHFSIDHGVPVLPTAIAGSYGILAKLPWWRLQPGRNIEITFCSPLESPAALGKGKVEGAMQALLESTRERLSAVLESSPQNGD